MILKIDYDSKNFSKWLDHFGFAYHFLKVRFVYDSCLVYETLHGFHIEIEMKRITGRYVCTPLLINALESILWSDLNKQLVCLVEREDILFSRKNGRERVLRKDLIARVDERARNVELKPRILKKYKIVLKGGEFTETETTERVRAK